MKAYEKLVREGRLHEYEKWVEATAKQKALEKANKEERTNIDIYIYIYCMQANWTKG